MYDMILPRDIVIYGNNSCTENLRPVSSIDYAPVFEWLTSKFVEIFGNETDYRLLGIGSSNNNKNLSTTTIKDIDIVIFNKFHKVFSDASIDDVQKIRTFMVESVRYGWSQKITIDTQWWCNSHLSFEESISTDEYNNIVRTEGFKSELKCRGMLFPYFSFRAYNMTRASVFKDEGKFPRQKYLDLFLYTDICDEKFEKMLNDGHVFQKPTVLA